MGYRYGSGITLDLTIGFKNPYPLDNRTTVLTEDDLDDIIKTGHPYVGLLTFVESTKRVYVCEGIYDDNNKIIGYKWNKLATDSGIPIYTNAMYNALDDKPDSYISINDPSDLDGEITNKQYITSVNGTYVDVLFKALRALLLEVAKLKNSFIYGINSYTDTDTALSTILEHYGDNIEEEPLWAIEPEGLTELVDLYEVELLEPNDNIEILEDDTTFKIAGTSTFSKLNELAPKDSKVISYFTCSNLGIVIYFNNDIELNLSSLHIPNVRQYHIMVVLSRTIEEKGDNYIWLSVDDNTTDRKLIEGYYDVELNEIVSLKTLLNAEERVYDYDRVEFTDIEVSNFKIYSKYQDFSDAVIASKPSELDYKYRTAHITIRSVKNYSTLDKIKKQILNNELIMVEESEPNKKSGLYIKSKDQIIAIGGTGGSNNNTDTSMTQEELILSLSELGIIYTNKDNQLQLNNIGNLTFIHEDSGKTYNVSIDAYGNLISNELNTTPTLESRLNLLKDNDFIKKSNRTYRGFTGQLGCIENGINPDDQKDAGLFADRIKIGAFYAPNKGREVFGCTHGYIELENTSNTDFNLDGCYLHYAYPMPNSSVTTEAHLKLTGVLPAGGTYLIRCKQYALFDDANAFIKVNTFDQEWYVNKSEEIDGKTRYYKELLDLSYEIDKGYAFCLTYGLPNLAYNTILYSTNNEKATQKKAPYLYEPYYIDSVGFINIIKLHGGVGGYWTTEQVMNLVLTYPHDAIFKNAFMLDPAKQAYQSLNTYDSSRVRNANASDYYYIPLEKEYIEFPKSDEKYAVALFTPKASYEHKNISTDKSKLNPNKPNMVTCAFGINHVDTRCFNWVSVGLFDEYVWIYDDNIENAIRIESYTKKNDDDATHTKSQTGDIIRKEFNPQQNNVIYARITGRFPGANVQYTIHKCIIKIINDKFKASENTPKQLKYIVGRSNKNGMPDMNHCSDEHTFTLYPASWRPRIYQTSDQQGFHWVEYQVWNAVAKLIELQIEQDRISLSASNNGKDESNFIPVLLNTGDMTQSGSRINEWFDYYLAGKNLFKKYEQINVVGNNDLCDVDLSILGTGDDKGKSNSYYFHLFYCYEIDPNIPPIINNKYVPSLYYLDFNNLRLILVNSELTITVALHKDWYNLNLNGKPVNPYTGWRVPSENVEGKDFKEYNYDDSFTTVYTMIYDMMNTNKNIITACHEMPFTVITLENLSRSTITKSRSLNDGSLVGSHLNQISSSDTQSNYWFSRLLEFKKSLLCLGGHKHTYAVTYPLCEYYTYSNNKNSKDDGPMPMERTLKNDTASFINNIVVPNESSETPGATTTVLVDTSKFPLINHDISKWGVGEFVFRPGYVVDSFKNNAKGVIYFMCQSSGFKLFSNKELPSPDQLFSLYIPKSNITKDDQNKVTESKADQQQRSPMYAIIDTNRNNKINVILLKLDNILAKPTVLFNTITYSQTNIQLKYLKSGSNDPYADWKEIDSTNINKDAILLTI